MGEIRQDKSSKAFRAWRKRMGLTQKQAADKLDIGFATTRIYDSGHRWSPEGPVYVPVAIRLACRAVEYGLGPIE